MVIAAFPAIGKTYFCEKYPDRAIDLECMPFKYSNYYEKLVDSEKEAIKAEYSLELRQGNTLLMS